MAGQLVLIADGNTGRGRKLADAFTTSGVECRLAPHGAAALELALAERPGVVIAEADLPLVDAFKLSEILRANPRTRNARFLFLSDAESLGARGSVGDRLLPLGSSFDDIYAVTESLFEKQTRIDALDAEGRAAHSFRGRLDELALADLLQMLQMRRRSGLLHLEPRGEYEHSAPGVIALREGDVIRAEVGVVENEKALFRMLMWNEGTFRFDPSEVEEPPMILAPTRALLAEGLRQQEEWDRLSPQLPPLDSPVKLLVKTSELPHIVHPLTQEVLLLLELYERVRDVVEHCAFPDYQVLRTLHTLAERGIVGLGRVPVPATSPEAAGLFNEAQIRRLRSFVLEGAPRGLAPPDAKLLVVGSSAHSCGDFAQLLARVPGAEISPRLERGQVSMNDLETIGRIAVDDDFGIELVHLPVAEQFAPIWPLAGHGGLGSLFLLDGSVGASSERVARVGAALSRIPRSRTFHVVLLGKDERIAPDELRENLSLIDEASLFLLPLESSKDPTTLMRSLFSRIVP